MTPLGPRAVFNVFACTDDVELLSRMMRMQQKYRDFCVRGFSSNAVLDGAFLKQQDILVIYLQFSLVEDRWYSWFETFATLQSRLAVRLIVSFSQIRSEYMHLLKYRIDSFLQEPFEMGVLHEHLLKQCQEAKESACWQSEVQNKIITLLMQMMIPSHLSGFQYLRIACEAAMDTPTNRQIVMKHLYSLTARRCHTTAERVEKCIRTAIHSAHIPPFFLEVFHDDPTNRKVVMYVYTCLKGVA